MDNVFKRQALEVSDLRAFVCPLYIWMLLHMSNTPHKSMDAITRIKYSSRSGIEIGGQGAKCLVMALCLGPGGPKILFGTYSHTKRCKIQARQQGP